MNHYLSAHGKTPTEKESPQDFILRLAFDRGFNGRTFATTEEMRTPGYFAAWERGAAEARCPEDALGLGHCSD